MPGVPGALGMPGWLCVAAMRRGFTPCGPVWLWPGIIWAGVLAPVGIGVEKADGISEVKMEAEGEFMNFCVIAPRRAWLKPVKLLASVNEEICDLGNAHLGLDYRLQRS